MMPYAQLVKRQSRGYWELVRALAEHLKSDGCSGPARITQAYRDACLEHDIHYRTGQMLGGVDITRKQADDLFWLRIRQMAWDGLSWKPWTWGNLLGFPMSWWRWKAVRDFAVSAYKGKEPS